MNLCTLLDEPARLLPDRTALVFPERSLSYAELEQVVRGCAAVLAARGVGRGDRVGVLDETSPLQLASILACARIGAAAVPLHAQLTARELAELWSTCGCHRVGVAGTTHAATLRAALEAVGGGEVLGEAELLDAADPEAAPAPVEDDALECLVILTSGTTGLPKPVGVTHGTLTPRIRGFSAGIDPAAPAAASILCVPAVHIGGIGGVLTAITGGGTTVVLRRFDPGEWLALAAKHRVTSAFFVPTMIRRILDHPEFDATDLSSLRLVSYGAAAAPVPLVEEMIRRFPKRVAFSNVFGQTETTGAITALGPDDHRLDEQGNLARPGSVGRPLPGVELRIVDPEGGEEVAPGEIGELWVRSPFNAAAGWRQTGDLVRRDAEGYLFPQGRLSDTINRGGEKFGPAEIEAVLRQHPAVADVAVAGIPDPELGERVGAAIVRRGPLDEEQVREHCRGSLARYKTPERIAFVDAIPHTPLFKVSRKAIAQLVQASLGARGGKPV